MGNARARRLAIGDEAYFRGDPAWNRMKGLRVLGYQLRDSGWLGFLVVLAEVGRDLLRRRK